MFDVRSRNDGKPDEVFHGCLGDESCCGDVGNNSCETIKLVPV